MKTVTQIRADKRVDSAQAVVEELRSAEEVLARSLANVARLQLAVSRAEEVVAGHVGFSSKISQSISDAQGAICEAQTHICTAHRQLASRASHYGIKDQLVMSGTGDKPNQ